MTTTAALHTCYQLEDLLLDTAQRRVTRDGQPIELSALNFDLLRLLVESAPNVVNCDDLAVKVWGRHFVSPENVAQRIKLLRQSLADDASEPRYIETVRGRGYRLIPTVQPIAASPGPARSARSRRRPLITVGAIAATLLVAAAFLSSTDLIRWLGKQPVGDESAVALQSAIARTPLPSSVAVLPFKNLSPDAEDAYFAAGIHEELIGQLAKISGLSVIAQTSVQRYANGDKSVPEIAAELNVETVMEGSVRYAGASVRVAANLIDADTGASRWSEFYDRELGDVFAIQQDIATNIASALGATLPSGHRASIDVQATKSPEAAALYLKVLNLQRQTSYEAAAHLQYLDSALEFDPNFANAYALKAMVSAYSVIDRPGGRAIDSELAGLQTLALENAARALELDPTATQAHLAIAEVHKFFWRWNDAIGSYERAFEISPNDIDVLVNFGTLLSWAGQHERAIKLLERAVQIDPGSPSSHLHIGMALAEAGRPAAAADVFRAAVTAAPTVVPLRHWLAQMEAILGHDEQALADLQAVERLSGSWSHPTAPTAVLYSYSLIGRFEDVARLANDVKALEANGSIGEGTWALMHLALGDADEAHRWLQLAVDKIENHEPDAGFLNLMIIKTNPHANPVLEERRFRELRDRIGRLD